MILTEVIFRTTSIRLYWIKTGTKNEGIYRFNTDIIGNSFKPQQRPLTTLIDINCNVQPKTKDVL